MGHQAAAGSGDANASGVSAATRELAEGACTTMQAALAALKDSVDASCPVPTRQQVAAAVQLVRMEVAKMGLLYNQAGGTGSTGGTGGTASTQGSSSSISSGPSDAEAEALLKGFQQAVGTLCMVYTGIAAGSGAGLTLRANLHQTATMVVEACVALVRGAVLGGARDAQLMMLSGFCLEMLGSAERAPLDSRTAIGRAITQVLRQLVDAMRELEEAIEAAGEADAKEEEAGGGVAAAAAEQAGEKGADADAPGSDADSDAGFGMFQSEAFNPQQLAVAQRVHGMLAAMVGMAKAVVKLLLAEREGLSPEEVEGWESMLYHIKGLAPVVDDLAAAAYPPQDTTELASAAEALATACELLRDECPAPATGGSSGEQEGQAGEAVAALALTGPLEAVQQAHGELAAELAGLDSCAAAAHPEAGDS